MINIMQHGSDGVGHQLYGLFTCMILHNVGDYKFSGYNFIKKSFNFQHLSVDEQQKCKLYLIEVMNLFIKKYTIIDGQFKGYIHSHEVNKIPSVPDENVLYGLDNAYYFDRLKLTDDEKVIHDKNICDMAPLFINKSL
jgi:hypothetical protein